MLFAEFTGGGFHSDMASPRTGIKIIEDKDRAIRLGQHLTQDFEEKCGSQIFVLFRT